ncbi:MAG: cupin domain-containing protein [Bacteroidetes bacterium]|nr:cupin domain-containing protein [Bacteroidota bacterium]
MKINKETTENYSWGKNCLSWILNNSEALSIKQELMPIGTKEQLHFHEKASQFFYILKGQATFYLEDEILILNPNDGVIVNNNMKHYIANESEVDIEFLVISQPNTYKDRINV